MRILYEFFEEKKCDEIGAAIVIVYDLLLVCS